jgi:hypothetical protein
MDGLRELFSEHNIEINDETVDVVAGLEEQIEELSNQATKLSTKTSSLQKKLLLLRQN